MQLHTGERYLRPYTKGLLNTCPAVVVFAMEKVCTNSWVWHACHDKLGMPAVMAKTQRRVWRSTKQRQAFVESPH